MADSKLNLPGGFGGLMRYDEEYESKIKITPTQVIVYVVLIIAFAVGLKMFWSLPVA